MTKNEFAEVADIIRTFPIAHGERKRVAMRFVEGFKRRYSRFKPDKFLAAIGNLEPQDDEE